MASVVCKHFWLILWIILAAVEGARLSPAASPVSGKCPLNFTILNSHPWMIQQCSQADKSHCCEGVLDLIRILLFSWLHSTRSFLLPNKHMAGVCLNALQKELETRNIIPKVLDRCNLQPDSFVSGSDSCNKIETMESFQRAADLSGVHQHCNGSGIVNFECHKCVRAMAVVLHQLQHEGSGQKTNCALFVMMYVGGGINSYEDLGPDAAYCLLGAQNLPELAADVNDWPIDQQARKNSKSMKIALGIAIPAAGIMLLLGMHFCFKWRNVCPLGGSQRSKLLRKQTELLRESVDGSTGIPFYSLAEIKAATGNFVATNMIGEGGFSTVYMGTLPNGSRIAVKKFKDSTSRADTEFRHEVQVISGVRHRNLLPLRGYCIGSNEEGSQEQFLVYDFMENGSLADYLFKGNRPCLSWPERHKIAVGIARGLAYLHEDAKPAIIHRDVKAANVLLDSDLNPLVADFGLAKFKPDLDKTHYTTRAVGTMGYVAPEYALYGHLTDKSDVFSFGILLLELMSGRKALDSTSGNLEHLLISDWACELIQKGVAEEVMDKRIRESGPKESMERVLLLALQCAHPRVACRPSIPQALFILEAIDHPLPDIISASTIDLEAEASSRKRGDLNWLVSPDMEGRISYGSMTMGSMSMGSYGSGR